MNINNSKTKASKRDLWETPQQLVDQVADILKVHIALDPCCTEKNRKCWNGCFKKQDGLKLDWLSSCNAITGFSNKAVWVNPPFSELHKWIDKVIEESNKGLTIVLVHPDTPDTAWYQKIEKNCLMQLVPTSRINYIDPEIEEVKSGVNFPSCISVFNGFPVTGQPTRVRFKLKREVRL
jgi:phage N-6-adenine-methyltransferase